METTQQTETTESPFALALTGLEPGSALAIETAFSGVFAQIAQWATTASTIAITSADQKREMKLARESRLGLVKVRTGADKIRKDLKSDILARGKAIDGVFKLIEERIRPIEARLLEQETYGERLEQERRARVRAERTSALVALEVPAMAMPAALDTMTDADWSTCLETFRVAHVSRQEAVRRATEERLAREKAEAEERERQRAEEARAAEARRVLQVGTQRGEVLRALLGPTRALESDEQDPARLGALDDAAWAAERGHAEKVRDDREARLQEEKRVADERAAQERAEREAAEAAAKAERDAVEAKHRADLEAQESAARIERETAAKREADERRAKEEAERERDEAIARGIEELGANRATELARVAPDMTLCGYTWSPSELGALLPGEWDAICRNAIVARDERAADALRVEREAEEARLELVAQNTRDAADAAVAAARAETQRAEEEASRLRQEAAARAARDAAPPDTLAGRFTMAVEALHKIAQWGQPLADTDEPHSAAKAREVLTTIGEAQT